MNQQTATLSTKSKSAGCSTSTLSLRKSIFSMKVTMKAKTVMMVIVEQAFVNYALGNGDVVTAGRYASMLGFEAFEPTGLYQFSTAYSASGLPGYAQGVKFTRESNTSFFGLSIQDEAFDVDSDDNNLSSSSYAIEAAYAQDLGNGFAVFIGGAFEDADAGDTYIVNAYTTYETGAWLFIGEYNMTAHDVSTLGELEIDTFLGGNDVDVMSGLVMANYAYSDDSSVTARLSYEEVEDENSVEGDNHLRPS